MIVKLDPGQETIKIIRDGATVVVSGGMKKNPKPCRPGDEVWWLEEWAKWWYISYKGKNYKYFS